MNTYDVETCDDNKTTLFVTHIYVLNWYFEVSFLSELYLTSLHAFSCTYTLTYTHIYSAHGEDMFIILWLKICNNTNSSLHTYVYTMIALQKDTGRNHRCSIKDYYISINFSNTLHDKIDKCHLYVIKLPYTRFKVISYTNNKFIFIIHNTCRTCKFDIIVFGHFANVYSRITL